MFKDHRYAETLSATTELHPVSDIASAEPLERLPLKQI